MRVLVVDDSKVMRSVVKGALAKLGICNVDEAGNGREALDRVAAGKPDLVLLDWNMPEMDGLGFLTQLRSSGDRTAVIMVTTEVEKTRVLEAIKAGVNNYCIKPFTPEALGRVIEKTMGPGSVKIAA